MTAGHLHIFASAAGIRPLRRWYQRLGRLTLPSERFKIVAATTDRVRMSINPMLYVTVAGSILTLYIMRRRVRLGRRTPTF